MCKATEMQRCVSRLLMAAVCGTWVLMYGMSKHPQLAGDTVGRAASTRLIQALINALDNKDWQEAIAVAKALQLIRPSIHPSIHPSVHPSVHLNSNHSGKSFGTRKVIALEPGCSSFASTDIKLAQQANFLSSTKVLWLIAHCFPS